MAIPLPDDFSTYKPSDRQQPLPANVEDSFEKGLGAQVQEALGNVVSYPGKIFAAATGADAPIQFPELPELTDMPGADMPSFFRRLMPNIKAMLTSDDLGKAEIFEASFGDDEKFGGVFVDDFGLPIVFWNDVPYYVNKPGFSEQDFSTFLGEVAKYSPASRFVGGAKTVTGTAARGAVAYPTTEATLRAGEALVTPKTVAARDEAPSEVVGDIATLALQDVAIDYTLPKVLKVAGKTIETAADKGGDITKKLVERAGKYNPFPRITPEQINKSRFPLTLGQRYSPIQDPRARDFTPQLATEDLIRFGNADTTAQETLKQFDRDQMEMIESAARDLQNELGVGVVAENYYQVPAEAGAEIQKIVADLAADKNEQSQLIYDALKQAQDESKPRFGPEAIKRITQNMMDYVTIDEGIYPSLLNQNDQLKPVFDMLKKINRQATGRKNFPEQTIDQISRFRDNLGYKIGNAQGSDKRILTQLKTRLDEGIDEAITAGLVSGDTKFIDDLRQAGKLYSEYNALSGGRPIAALRKLPDAEKAVQKGLRTLANTEYDTLEVLNLLFGKNLLQPRKHMGLLIDELQKILPEDEMTRVRGLLRDGVLTRAFAGTGGKISRLSIAKNFDEVFTKQKDIIERLFTADEIKKVKDLKNDVLPTLAAELRKNPSATGYIIQGFLQQLGLHSVPQFGLTPDARVARALLEESAEQLSARKQKGFVADIIRGKITEMRSPLFSEDARATILGNLTAEDVTQAALRPQLREDEEEQEEAGRRAFRPLSQEQRRQIRRPDRATQDLRQRIRDIQDMQADASATPGFFDPLPVTTAPARATPSAALSPTILPSDQDRELAARQAGIGALI